MYIFRVMNAVPYSNAPAVKDVIAQLHSYFTCNLLIGLSILLSYKQFGGRPIECMTPQGFTSAWNEYTEQYCFSSSTYYVPFSQAVAIFGHEERMDKQINYYQLMSFFLLFQAACFKIPTLLWKYFAGQSGIKVGEILRLATNESNSEPAMRADNIHSLRVHLQGALRFHSILKKKKLTPHKVLRPLNIKYSSHYVSTVYLVAKTAFFLNVVCQIYMLSHYLLPEHNLGYSLSVWRGLMSGNSTWKESGLFPRVTLCDFEVREMGQSQNHTIQCVLLLNIFTEKVFIILWAWYSILSAVTCCNLLSWIYALFNDRSTEHFILNHLEMSGERVFSNDCPKGLTAIQIQVERFICKYLRTDGIFILRLIAQHADVVFTTDLIYKLWQSHYLIEKQRESLRMTEKRWQEHLRRFEAIEARGRGGGDRRWPEDAADMDELADKFDLPNDYSSFKPSQEPDGKADLPRGGNASLISTPFSSSHTSPSLKARRRRSLVPNKQNRRFSNKFRHPKGVDRDDFLMRRTMSAESIREDASRIFKMPSEEDENFPFSPKTTTDDETSPKKRKATNEQKPYWFV